MKKFLSVGETVKFGWNTFKKNWGFFVSLILLAWITPLIPHAIGMQLQPHYPIWAGVFFVIYFVLAILVNLGLVNIGLIVSKNQKASFADLYKPWKKIVNFFIGSIFYTAMILVGLVLLIFPGIIWATRYGLFQYFIVDKDLGPIEAFRSSAKTTMGAKWDYLSLLLVFLLMMIAGALCFFVGTLVAYPIVMIAHAFAYRKLLEQTKELQIPEETNS